MTHRTLSNLSPPPCPLRQEPLDLPQQLLRPLLRDIMPTPVERPPAELHSVCTVFLPNLRPPAHSLDHPPSSPQDPERGDGELPSGGTVGPVVL